MSEEDFNDTVGAETKANHRSPIAKHALQKLQVAI